MRSKRLLVVLILAISIATNIVAIFTVFPLWFNLSVHYGYDLDIGVVDTIATTYIMRGRPEIMFPDIRNVTEKVHQVYNNDDEAEMLKARLPLVEIYKHKVIRSLEMCSTGSTEFCIILEDDVALLYDIAQSRRIILENIITKYGNYDTIYDCSKTGAIFHSHAVRGNGLLCRVIPAKSAKRLAEKMKEDEQPADISLAIAASKCSLKEKRFKLVEHLGYKSTLNH